MENMIKSEDTFRKNRVPPGQYMLDKWPVLHYDGIPDIEINKWRFEAFGLVENKLNLSYKEFASLPKVKVFADIHCVTTWSKLDNILEGVSSKTITDLARPLPEAKFVLLHSYDNYTTNLSLPEFLSADVVFTYALDNTPLTPEYGYPLRLVVPKLYFWKSPKWVKAVEFLKDDKPGFWETRGYHNHGDPWTEERYS